MVSFRAELQCPAMDDDSLDEPVDQSPGPDGHPRLSPAALAGDAGALPSHLSPLEEGCLPVLLFSFQSL